MCLLFQSLFAGLPKKKNSDICILVYQVGVHAGLHAAHLAVSFLRKYSSHRVPNERIRVFLLTPKVRRTKEV